MSAGTTARSLLFLFTPPTLRPSGDFGSKSRDLHVTTAATNALEGVSAQRTFSVPLGELIIDRPPPFPVAAGSRSVACGDLKSPPQDCHRKFPSRTAAR